jgi:hypothetical protein
MQAFALVIACVTCESLGRRTLGNSFETPISRQVQANAVSRDGSFSTLLLALTAPASLNSQSLGALMRVRPESSLHDLVLQNPRNKITRSRQSFLMAEGESNKAEGEGAPDAIANVGDEISSNSSSTTAQEWTPQRIISAVVALLKPLGWVLIAYLLTDIITNPNR